MSLTLEDQIFHYSNSTFDPEESARHFFSEHSENEVHQKLNELANLQNQIETNLRHKVRDNYSLFMFANDEINRVGEEMSDLKHLLNATKKMLEELQSLRPAPQSSPVMSSVTSISTYNIKADNDGSRNSPMSSPGKPVLDTATPSSQSTKSIPSWVLTTPQEVERFIVEQQYSKAVTLVVRSLAYLDRVRVVGGGGGQEVNEHRAAIQRNRLLLAHKLRDSLATLSSSALFGAAEQTKRLKLLITLGHSALAAQGFATGRKDGIRKALRYVEASGDPAAFTAELSRVFFVNLREACKSFLDLFAKPPSSSSSSHGHSRSSSHNHRSDAVDTPSSDEDDSDSYASLSYLVGWLQDQMTVFVTALARQIQVGAAEYAAEVFQLPLSVLLKQHDEAEVSSVSPSEGSGRGGGRGGSLSPAGALKRTSSLFYTDISSPADSGSGMSSRGMRRTSSVSRASISRSTSFSRTGLLGSVSPSTRPVSLGERGPAGSSSQFVLGPLTFTSHCLQVAFREAVVLDQLGLQGASSLSWNMMPEIKAIVNSFADDIIKDLEGRVAQDDWQRVRCTQSEVRLPRSASAPSKNKKPEPEPEVLPKPKKGLSSLFGGISFAEDDDMTDVVENSLSNEISIYTSSSYQRVSALLTYFIAEVYSLLQVGPPVSPPGTPSHVRHGHGNSSAEDSMYSRVDLCELEPEAVACILRILIRYVRAMISLDLRVLNHAQRECYDTTVEEIKVSLLPSAEDAIIKGFFSDGSTLVANPPKAVFKHLRENLQAASFREDRD